jgi:hypothetical protein
VYVQNLAHSNHEPNCTILFPLKNAIVHDEIAIEGTASDTDGNNTVCLVEIKIDLNNWVTATGTVSWSHLWNTTALSDGTHTISARSKDVNDSYSPIDSIGVVVLNNASNNHKPSCTIISPLDGQIVFGTTVIQGNADDPDGTGSVDSVEVRVDSGPWSSSIGTASWSFSWNTLTTRNGSHMINARSHDNNGTYSDIVSIDVIVDNGASLGWFEGIVKSDNLSALSGAEIRITQTGNMGATDGLGRFNITVEVGNHYSVKANAINHIDAQQTDENITKNNVTNVDFILTYNGPNYIYCSIDAPADSTVVGGVITVSGEASDRKSMLSKVEVRVDSSSWNKTTGKSSWSYVVNTTKYPNGIHNILARSTDGLSYSPVVTVKLIFNNSIVKNDGWLAGYVISNYDEQPIENATILIVELDEKCYTDDNGAYNISLPAGNYKVRVSAKEHSLWITPGVTIIKGKTTSIDFFLTAYVGTLRGIVLDDITKSPIENALITIMDSIKNATTNSSGGYIIQDLKTQNHVVIVSADGYINSSEIVTVENNKTIFLNFSLTGLSCLNGTVIDKASGTPIEQATIIIGLVNTSSDINGEYYVDICAGRYSITVTKEGYNNFSMNITLLKGINHFDILMERTAQNGNEDRSIVAYLQNQALLLLFFAIAIIAIVLVIIIRIKRSKKMEPVTEGKPPPAPSIPKKIIVPSPPQKKKIQLDTGKLGMIEQSILDLIKEHPGAEPKWIARVLDLRIDNVREHIKSLTNAGYIRVVQSDDKEDIQYFITENETKKEG